MHDLFMKLACCGKDEREGRIGRRRQSHGERQCLSLCLSLCLSVSASSSASVLVMCPCPCASVYRLFEMERRLKVKPFAVGYGEYRHMRRA